MAALAVDNSVGGAEAASTASVQPVRGLDNEELSGADDRHSVQSDEVVHPSGSKAGQAMRKFLELKAKNAAKKAEKARKSAEAKVKYGNKFNELKAKNEERAKRKEEEKMKKKAQPVPDDESSGTEWF